MPIVPRQHQQRDELDDFLDAPDAPVQTAAPSTRDQYDAFLDAPDRPGIVASAQPPPQRGAISRLSGSFWEQANPKGIVQTAADFVPREPADLLVARPIRQAYEAGRDLVLSGAEDLGAGNTATGIRKMVTGLIPLAGPSLNRAGEQIQQGDYAGAIGTTLGIAANLFGPGVLAKSGAAARAGGIVRRGIQNTANRIYRIGAPGMTEELAQFGTTRGIPQTESAYAPGGPGDVLLQESGQAIGGPIRSAPQNRTVSPGPVITGLEDLKGKYLKSEAPAIDLEKQKFLDELRSQPGAAVPNMTPEEALDLKVKYQNRVRRERSTAYSRGLTENSPEIASARTVPSELGDQLVAQFPEITEPNRIYGLTSELEPVITHVADLAKRKNVLPTIGTIGAGAAAGLVTGQAAVGTAAGIAAELMRNPSARSYLAIALSKAARVPVPTAAARIGGYLNALAQSSDSGEYPSVPAGPR